MTKLQLYPFYPFNDSDNPVTIEENVAAFKHPNGHYCGYCVLSNDLVPMQARGTYDAPGMQYLPVHGGITYAEGKVDDRTWKGWFLKPINTFLNRCAYFIAFSILRRWYDYKRKKEMKAGANALEATSPILYFTKYKEMETWVSRYFSTHQVYGFDCNHFDDENNPMCQDAGSVLKHSKEMMFLLLLLFQDYGHFLRSSRDEQLEILDELREETDEQDLGLGAMLKALQGQI